MKCKPKSYGTLEIMNWKFVIDLKPQQKWDYKKDKDNFIVSRDNVSMTLSKTEFDKYFTIIDNKEN